MRDGIQMLISSSGVDTMVYIHSVCGHPKTAVYVEAFSFSIIAPPYRCNSCVSGSQGTGPKLLGKSQGRRDFSSFQNYVDIKT